MKVGLFVLIFCVWILNKQIQVSCQRQNRNFKEEAFNGKWIPQRGQNQHFFYIKHHERQNDQHIKSNMSNAPYAVGQEEALYLRHHFFREKDNQGRLIPNREYNKVHLRAQRMKIMDGHRIVPHHLEDNEQPFDRPEGYVGVYYKSFKRNDKLEAQSTTTSSGMREKFQNLGNQIRDFFVRNQSNENPEASSINYPKHRKRSEFELIPKWNPNNEPSTADEVIPNENEESEFVNRFIMPRIAQLSFQEKSSKIFDKNFHITCEKDEKTQRIQCRNVETNVIRKAEDSVMHSHPNSKISFFNIPAERNSN